MTEQSIAEVAAGLSGVQRERLVSLNPHDVDRFHYHHFKGQSRGLFQVAPGWQRMKLSPRGDQVRSHLISQGADHDR